MCVCVCVCVCIDLFIICKFELVNIKVEFCNNFNHLNLHVIELDRDTLIEHSPYG